MPTISALREQAGRTQTALDAWELENGCRPKPGPSMDQHNALLTQNCVAKSELRAAEAILTGTMNFHPRNHKTNT